jgi:hypothetical protein
LLNVHYNILRGGANVLTKARKAQSTLEYALLIGVVVGVLLTMQNYLKRSLQGRLQSTSDELGEHYAPGDTKREEHMKSSINQVLETSTFGPEGKTNTVISGGRQELDTHREIRAYNREDYNKQ